MKRLWVLCLALVVAPAWGQASKALTVAYESGKAIGAAQVCGVSEKRLRAVGQHAALAIVSVEGVSPSARVEGQAIKDGHAAGVQSVKSGATSCKAAVALFEVLESTSRR